MACCRSLLARKLALWYILLGTIVILPLTYSVAFGCQFINVGFDSKNTAFQGLNIFKTSVYAEAQTGSNDLGKFLGCVNYSQYWEDQTEDIGFTIARIAGRLLLVFITLATVTNICVQCFSKHGKSHLWNFMRICYIMAFFCQASMYVMFASDMCTDTNNEQKCWPGQNGIVGVVNSVLLLGMVVTTMVSFPPSNPVFQCWENDENSCSDSDDGSTGSDEDDDDENATKSKSIGGGGSVSDGVSLFGGSRTSRRSRAQQSRMTEEEEISIAEKGLSTASSKLKGLVISSFKSNRSSISGSKIQKISSASSYQSMSVPGVEKYLVKSESGSISNKSVRSKTSQKSVSGSVSTVEPYLVTENNGSGEDASIVTSSDKASASSQRSSNNSQCSFRSKIKTASESVTGSLAPFFSNKTAEISNFIEQLVEITELTEGGRRVKTEKKGTQIELVDEYPKKADGEIQSNPSSDLVKIRTEYYDLGSRTVKEISHSDGSCTVITTILANPASDEPVPTEQQVSEVNSNKNNKDIMSSAGSIRTPSSSKSSAMARQEKIDP